jgi:choline kinase
MNRERKSLPKALILAAGEGTRLRPYTLDRPKCLVEVDGRSLLDRQLDVMRAEGLENIILVGGYLADRLEHRGLSVRRNPRYAETNMVWTLFCAESELDAETVVSYGDIVYSRKILRALLGSSADVAVVIDRAWESYWRARAEDPLDDAETLKLAPDGRIIEVGQKPRSLAEIEGQYIGLMKFSVQGLAVLKDIFHKAQKTGTLRGKQVEKAYMTDLLQAVIDSGYRVEAVPVDGGWVEVDTVSDLNLPVTRERVAAIARE